MLKKKRSGEEVYVTVNIRDEEIEREPEETRPKEDEKHRRETAIVGVTEETKREKSTGPPNYPASRLGPTHFGPIPSRSCP
ncbi:hypothetical protein YC2023_039447 [Brassica napus]